MLDTQGVGELVKIAIERGRKTRPDLEVGICGEHGGEPSSVEFCARNGFTYVSCSPFRVLTARLAAAQRPLVDLVGAQRLVDQRAVLQRLLGVGDDRQRLVLDHDVLGRVDDRVAVLTEHDGHGVADVLDGTARQRPVVGRRDVDARRHPRHGQRRGEVEVLAGEHGDDVVARQLHRHGGWRVKSTGDGVLATFAGLPSDALRCARDLLGELEGLGLAMRAGLHTGECELIGDDVGGMAVHIAARVCELGGPGEVLVSGTVFGTVVGSELPFADLGSRRLKGVRHPWPIFAMVR